MHITNLNIVTLPIWWYTTGLSLYMQWMSRKYSFYLHKSGLSALVKHWREPLYGDYTRSGIFLSFFLRLILSLGKSLVLGVKLLLLILSLLLYIVILPAVLVVIFYQIFGLSL